MFKLRTGGGRKAKATLPVPLRSAPKHFGCMISNIHWCFVCIWLADLFFLQIVGFTAKEILTEERWER